MHPADHWPHMLTHRLVVVCACGRGRRRLRTASPLSVRPPRQSLLLQHHELFWVLHQQPLILERGIPLAQYESYTRRWLLNHTISGLTRRMRPAERINHPKRWRRKNRVACWSQLRSRDRITFVRPRAAFSWMSWSISLQLALRNSQPENPSTRRFSCTLNVNVLAGSC